MSEEVIEAAVAQTVSWLDQACIDGDAAAIELRDQLIRDGLTREMRALVERDRQLRREAAEEVAKAAAESRR